MVIIQTTHREALAVGLQFAANPAVLSTIMNLHGKAAARPKLALGAKPVWRLEQGHQEWCPNRTDRRNLAKQFHGCMLATFQQQLVARFQTQRLQTIQLLI